MSKKVNNVLYLCLAKSWSQYVCLLPTTKHQIKIRSSYFWVMVIVTIRSMTEKNAIHSFQ